jgi:hypothetical protein
VNAFAHDGTSLFVAGNFTHINGVAASGVARWDGTAWQPLGGGVRVNGPDFPWLWEVRDLAFVGGQLYAGGRFIINPHCGRPEACATAAEAAAGWHGGANLLGARSIAPREGSQAHRRSNAPRSDPPAEQCSALRTGEAGRVRAP